MNYCHYFQAELTKELVWFATSVLRGHEHLVFDRTLDPQRSLFEFFVPSAQVDEFLAIMLVLKDCGVVHNLAALPNRLQQQGATVFPEAQESE